MTGSWCRSRREYAQPVVCTFHGSCSTPDSTISVSHTDENVDSTRPVELYGIAAIELEHALDGGVITIDLDPAVGEAG